MHGKEKHTAAAAAAAAQSGSRRRMAHEVKLFGRKELSLNPSIREEEGYLIIVHYVLNV